MKVQKEQVEKRLNNLIGKSKQMKPEELQRMQLGLEHELKCFGKTINELNMQIHSLKQEEKELKLWEGDSWKESNRIKQKV